ncbi:MAG: pirin family protein [Acidobacteria bacterium]|nr:pirin family protein [Acidobacteriota bacterium]
MKIRHHNERGKTEIDWLKSYHSFSFNTYYDPTHIHFRSLRVINEDYVKEGGGFPTHSHQNMEIITYILSGKLEHKDSLGNGSIIHPGEIQRMSAGTGISHSEYNGSELEPVHFLQIWIIPEKKGLSPGYEQKSISKTFNKWHLIASQNGDENSITVHQDIKLFLAKLNKDNTLDYQPNLGRYTWIQIAKGKVLINEKLLESGDGAATGENTSLNFLAKEDAEILLFDLA